MIRRCEGRIIASASFVVVVSFDLSSSGLESYDGSTEEEGEEEGTNGGGMGSPARCEKVGNGIPFVPIFPLRDLMKSAYDSASKVSSAPLLNLASTGS